MAACRSLLPRLALPTVVALLLAACTTPAPAPAVAVAAPAAVPAAPEAFYREIEHLDRIYVLGTPAAAAAFAQVPVLPAYRACPGAGPEGRTVVLQADPRDPALAERLRTTFAARHGVDLP